VYRHILLQVRLHTWLTVVTSALFCLSCGQPTRGVRARPSLPPPSPISEPELSGEDARQGASSWQTIKVVLEAKPITGPTVSLTGYDQVAPILGRKEYACFGCHASEWPFLSRKGGWPRLMESLGDAAKPSVTTKQQLAAIIVGCMDVTTEDYCAGDPNDTTDTVAAKMPTKFGRKRVGDDDMLVLRKWLQDGAPELSSNPATAVDLTKLASYEFVPTDTQLVETRPSLVERGPAVISRELTVEARPRGRACEPTSLEITLKGVDNGLLTKASLPLSCNDQGSFTYSPVIQL